MPTHSASSNMEQIMSLLNNVPKACVPTNRRWRYALVIGVVLPAIVLVLDMARLFREQPVVGQYYASAKTLFSSCPRWCSTDPFLQPGMMHWSPSGADNETRWLPFPLSHEEWDVQPASSDLPHTDFIPFEAWMGAPPQYTAAIEQAALIDSVSPLQVAPSLEFLKNRTVILIGSSHDRNNVDQLCEIITGKKGSWGGHEGGYCYHAALDLLITNWFLFGMIDSNDGWPGPGEKKPYPFEDRLEQLMLPEMEKLGFSARKPDLIIASSLFWDEKFLKDDRAKSVDHLKSHGFWWNELSWFRGRVRKLVATIRQMYPHTPMMFRTRQLRAVAQDFHLLTIFQLDQGLRALGTELGIRLFTWGDKLEGYNVYYDNDQHFAKGPNTYLFGDMLFFYLHRATTPGCWACAKD